MLLVAGTGYATFSLVGEVLYSYGFRFAPDYRRSFLALDLASRLWPLQHYIARGPAEAVMMLDKHVEPNAAVQIMIRALKDDPYSADLLAGVAVQSMRADLPQTASIAFNRLKALAPNSQPVRCVEHRVDC